jgi:hypothetical protein
MVAERREGTIVGRHGVVGEVAPHDRRQTASLLRDVLVPAPPKVFDDFQQLRHLAVASRMAGQQKFAPPRSRADVREAQKVEEPAPAEAGVSGLPSPRPARSDAARLPNSISQGVVPGRTPPSGCVAPPGTARPPPSQGQALDGCAKPTTVSSAYRTTIIAPCAWRRRHVCQLFQLWRCRITHDGPAHVTGAHVTNHAASE